MLKQLYVRQYLLIEETTIEFDGGFTAITGETGAGKSLMLGALGLILGERLAAGIKDHQEDKCVIEATFAVAGIVDPAWFGANGLDYDPETIIRREITPTGKSRAFINDTPVSLQLLKELGARLVDIHGQHQNQALLRPEQQLSLLDWLAGLETEREEYRRLYLKWDQVNRRIAEQEAEGAREAKERAFVEFQLQELDKAQLEDPDELRESEEQLGRLENAEQIKNSLHLVYNAIEGEDGISERLNVLESTLKDIQGLASEYGEMYQRLQSAEVELKDLAREAFRACEQVEVSPADQERTSARVDQLNTLLQKHRLSDLESLMQLRDELRRQLQQADEDNSTLKTWKQERDAMWEQLSDKGKQLRDKRMKAIPGIKHTIRKMLTSVSLPDVQMQLKLVPRSEPHRNGADELQWLVSFNKGTPPGLLQKTASGGELSRFMLCLKRLLAEKTAMPCLILDEIDSGVSGEVAVQVGDMIRAFGEQAQVICITHLPQVAGKARRQMKVSKASTGGKTTTVIRNLSESERVNELAEMIAGKQKPEEAVASARILLKK